MTATLIDIVDDEILPAEVLSRIRSPRCGGLVLFLGSARSPSGGREIEGLRYEAYPAMARATMHRLVDEARERWELGGVALIHRDGWVGAGEISLLIAVAAPHRAEAYGASRFLLEALKREVPLWKKECGEGEERWV